MKDYVTIWTEDDATMRAPGHVGLHAAWANLFGSVFDTTTAEIHGLGYGVEYVMPNGAVVRTAPDGATIQVPRHWCTNYPAVWGQFSRTAHAVAVWLMTHRRDLEGEALDKVVGAVLAENETLQERKTLPFPRPRIVCLCGSTRFAEDFASQNRTFTLAGYVVLSVGFFGHQEPGPLDEDVKSKLDVLHLRKIDMADVVFFINKGGYIGESGQRELAYAIAKNKPVTFLAPSAGEKYMQENAHKLGCIIAAFAAAGALP